MNAQTRTKLQPGTKTQPRTKMLIDCDPGVDDAIALLVSMQQSDLVGITTVNGNVSIDHTTRNALAVVEVAGTNTEVHRGAHKPLIEPVIDAGHVHGPAGLGGVEVPVSRDITSDDAIGFILDTARSTDNLHLVAVGPLTNIALAVQADPTLPARLASFTIMGGAIGGGNVTATAEFNIAADPEAAAIVFGSFPMTKMVGLDVTHRVLFNKPESDRLRATGTAAAVFAADLLSHCIERAHTLRGFHGAPVHDATAVVSVLRPDLFEGVVHPVDVELRGTLTRGMTVVDRRGVGRDGHLPKQSNAHVFHDADASKVVNEVLDAVIALQTPEPDQRTSRG